MAALANTEDGTLRGPIISKPAVLAHWGCAHQLPSQHAGRDGLSLVRRMQRSLQARSVSTRTEFQYWLRADIEEISRRRLITVGLGKFSNTSPGQSAIAGHLANPSMKNSNYSCAFSWNAPPQRGGT